MTETDDLEREGAAVATAGFAIGGVVTETAAKEIAAAAAVAVAAAAVISATAETVNAAVPRDSAGISAGPVPGELSAAKVFADSAP